MRLIDADELKKRMSNAIIEDEHILEIIDEAPTTYDVEKVVGQINAIGKSYCDIFDCNKDCKDCDHGCLMRKIVEEVKEGGLNDTSNN